MKSARSRLASRGSCARSRRATSPGSQPRSWTARRSRSSMEASTNTRVSQSSSRPCCAAFSRRRDVQHEPRHAVSDGGLEGAEEHLTNPGVDPPLEFLPGLRILEHPGCERGSIDVSSASSLLARGARIRATRSGCWRASWAASSAETTRPRARQGCRGRGRRRQRRSARGTPRDRGSRGSCTSSAGVSRTLLTGPQTLGNRWASAPLHAAVLAGPESRDPFGRVRPGRGRSRWLPARAGVPRRSSADLVLPTAPSTSAGLDAGSRGDARRPSSPARRGCGSTRCSARRS